MVAVVAPGLRQPLASAPPQQGALCAPNLPPAAPSSRLRERLGCNQLAPHPAFSALEYAPL